ncbi:unnamed protein product [Vicia faba]|uniref:Uncharacterized protein n=1 Tax=Vicia faba TaxID=3906 RepID=A0AAV1B6V1_VICFA|nr:unnamed protein product [Vicia faba]
MSSSPIPNWNWEGTRLSYDSAVETDYTNEDMIEEFLMSCVALFSGKHQRFSTINASTFPDLQREHHLSGAAVSQSSILVHEFKLHDFILSLKIDAVVNRESVENDFPSTSSNCYQGMKMITVLRWRFIAKVIGMALLDLGISCVTSL